MPGTVDRVRDERSPGHVGEELRSRPALGGESVAGPRSEDESGHVKWSVRRHGPLGMDRARRRAQWQAGGVVADHHELRSDRDRGLLR